MVDTLMSATNGDGFASFNVIRCIALFFEWFHDTRDVRVSRDMSEM